MNEFLQTVVIIVTSLGGWTLLAWFVKRLASHFLTKDVEKFKNDLKFQADIAAEQLKAQLRMVAHEHEVKFSRLHEERAEVIKKMYSLLVELITKAEIFLLPGSVENRALEQETGECINNLSACFKQSRIYLDIELCKQIECLLVAIRDAFAKRTILAEWRPQSKEEEQEWRRILLETYNVIIKEVPPIQLRLEEEFRRILSPSSVSVPVASASKH
jgi:hypothetical protein